MFYVYEWFIKTTGEIFYVGKGTGKRYLVKKRNYIFNAILENEECDVRIIKTFEDESESFKYEEQRIQELWARGQAKANLHFGGNGGVSSAWTDEMKEKMSRENPMKDERQKQRMREQNPMKIPEVAKKVALSKSKAVIINGEEFPTPRAAAEYYSVGVACVYNWMKRGYTTEGLPCHYKNEQQLDYTFSKTCSRAVSIDGQIFPSLRAAGEFLQIKDTSPLCRTLKQNKPYKGHICSYVNQQPSRENSNNSISEGSTTNG